MISKYPRKSWKGYIFTSASFSVCVSVGVSPSEKKCQLGGCTYFDAVFPNWLLAELAQTALASCYQMRHQTKASSVLLVGSVGMIARGF